MLKESKQQPISSKITRKKSYLFEFGFGLFTFLFLSSPLLLLVPFVRRFIVLLGLNTVGTCFTAAGDGSGLLSVTGFVAVMICYCEEFSFGFGFNDAGRFGIV